jgi:GWxTD domain-containing protein
MILILALLATANTINFYADPVVYRSTLEMRDTIAQTTRIGDIFYIEFNCGIPYYELSFETSDTLIVAKVAIAFVLRNLNRPDSITDTLYRQYTIPSFAQAAQEQLLFLTQFGLHVPEGSYAYDISVSSGDKTGHVTGEIMTNRDNYRMSDILIAKNIVYDTIDTYLHKGSLRVVPHPSHIFNERYSRLYVYYEVYDIVPNSGRLKIRYIVTDSAGTLISQIPRFIDKRYESQAMNFGLSIQDLEAGMYMLTIEISSENDEFIAQKKVPFEIRRAVQKEVTYENLPYYDEIEYFLSSKEYKKFQKLSAEGKKNYLDKFWRENDYVKIAQRFEEADMKYTQGSAIGHTTERGRIYVKYGKPDEIAAYAMQYEELRPYERWQYYNGDEFIFVDIYGTNEYVLVWTNVNDEVSQPTLYKYLPKDIQEEIKY